MVFNEADNLVRTFTTSHQMEELHKQLAQQLIIVIASELLRHAFSGQVGKWV